MHRGWMLVLVTACGLDRNIESEVQITHGVYGQLVHACDVATCQDQPLAGVEVSAIIPGARAPIATNTSNADGVYQLGVISGDYFVCTPSSCTPAAIYVPEHDRVRYDWLSGPNGGRWQHP